MTIMTHGSGPCDALHLLAQDIAWVVTPIADLDALARETFEHLRRLRVTLGMTGSAPAPGEPDRERDGMLRLDAEAADHLGALGPNGVVLAHTLRREAKERWRRYVLGTGVTTRANLWSLWLSDSSRHGASPFAWMLCTVLWLDVVRPRIEARVSHAGYPA